MSNSDYFIHAYNFVRSKSNKEISREDITKNKNSKYISGSIDCSLYVKTPLSIPDSDPAVCMTNYKEVKGHTAFPFFSVADIPVIPGSEIRGMTRNVYEILTDSCFSVINSNELSSRNITPNSATRTPGLLSFDETANEWKLKKADRLTAYTESKKNDLISWLNASGKESGRDYFEREWTLSVQLDTNMQKLKEAIDKKIQVAENFNDLLKQLKNLQRPIEYIEPDSATMPGVKCFIFSSKKDKGTTPAEKIKNNCLNSVNAAKKWGDQYSEANLNAFFILPGSQNKSQEYRKNYQEHVINYSVFIPVPGAAVSVDEKAVKNLDRILDYYFEYNDKKDPHKWIDNARPAKNKTVPVFFHTVGSETVLTPASFSRELYTNTVEDILKDRKKCTSGKKCCPACQLFGLIGKSDSDLSVGSKIRFSDAVAESGYKINKDFTPLKILASPKTTGYEFYATAKYDDPDVQLRGRKMYFHNPAAAQDPSVYTRPDKRNEPALTNMNSSVQLVTSGKFFFKVYFDNITEDELKTLIMSLTLGENQPDGNLAHKIGHGKPLGLGSVKICVDKASVRRISDKSYTVDDSAFSEYLKTLTGAASKTNLKSVSSVSDDTVNDLLNICNYHFCDGYAVSYPVVEPAAGYQPRGQNDIATHKYFAWMRNRTGFRNNAHQTVCNELPVVGNDAKATAMPVLTYDGQNLSQKGNVNNTLQPVAAHQANITNQLVIGQHYTGVTQGFAKNKNFIRILLDNGTSIGLFKDKLSENCYNGTKIEIIYKRKNNNGYDIFDLVQIL